MRVQFIGADPYPFPELKSCYYEGVLFWLSTSKYSCCEPALHVSIHTMGHKPFSLGLCFARESSQAQEGSTCISPGTN